MIEEIHARARLVAHHDDMVGRLLRRIEALRRDATGPEWTRRTAEAIARYEDEIATTQETIARLQAENHGPPRPGARRYG